MRCLARALLLVALASAVAEAAAPPAPPAAPSAPRTEPPELREAPVPVMRLEVQTLGEEPRQRIRTGIKEGATASIDLVVEGMVSSSIDGAGRVRERPLPVRWTLDLRVRSVAAGGGATIEAMVRDAAPQRHPLHPQEHVEATTAAVAALRGQRLELELSSEGGLVAARLPSTAFSDGGLSLPLARLVEALCMVMRPAPSDPVGKDARWQVRVDRQFEGADRIEVTTWVVKSVAGAAAPDSGAASEGVSAAITVVVRAAKPRQPLAEGRLPDCRFIVLEQLSGSGMGTVRWSGASFVPQEQREQVLVTLFAEGLHKETEERRRLNEQTLMSVKLETPRSRRSDGEAPPRGASPTTPPGASPATPPASPR